MASTNLIYDNCAYNQQKKYDKSACNYQLYKGQAIREKNCRINFGVVGGNDVSLYRHNLVDLESELRGQTRVASLCGTNKYLPNNNHQQNNYIHLPECQIMCKRPLCLNSYFVCTHCNTNEKDRCQ